MRLQAYTASFARTTVRYKMPEGLHRLLVVAKRSDFLSPTDLCSPAWTAEFRFCTTIDEVRKYSLSLFHTHTHLFLIYFSANGL